MSTASPHDIVDSAPRYRGRPLIVAFGVDAVLVIIFAAIGRASHGEDLLGVWGTAWTFLLALVVGWAVAVAWRAPFAPLRTGVPVWAVTVAGGMVLRGLSGQGVQVAFVVVAGMVLLVFLVGWRVVASAVRRRQRAKASSASTP